MKSSPALRVGLACLALALLAGCVAEAPQVDQPPPDAGGPRPGPDGSATPSAREVLERTRQHVDADDAGAGFVDIVWRVAESAQVQEGQLYVFLSTGALVAASGNGTPAIGSWSGENGKLATMTEDGVTYPIEVLALDTRQFRIRSLNPGKPVEMTLERATPR